MNDHGEFRVEPVRSKAVSRVVPIATFLVGIFLGAALVKPWDLFFPAPTPAIAQRPIGLGERRPIAQSVTDPAARRVRVRGRLAGLRARRAGPPRR